jgi:hypothetical protein
MMKIDEKRVTKNMLTLARQMHAAFARNCGAIPDWDELSQELRDAWCAAAVEAFTFVAEMAANR